MRGGVEGSVKGEDGPGTFETIACEVEFFHCMHFMQELAFVSGVKEGKGPYGSACASSRLVHWVLCSSINKDLCSSGLRRRRHYCRCITQRVRSIGRVWILYRVLHLCGCEEGVTQYH